MKTTPVLLPLLVALIGFVTVVVLPPAAIDHTTLLSPEASSQSTPPQLAIEPRRAA